jgi:hypothetical protein
MIPVIGHALFHDLVEGLQLTDVGGTAHRDPGGP